MTESICGWTPPTIYDIRTDQHRIVTQEDITVLQRKECLLHALIDMIHSANAKIEDARKVSTESMAMYDRLRSNKNASK